MCTKSSLHDENDCRFTLNPPIKPLLPQRNKLLVYFCCHSTLTFLCLSHLLQPCPLSSPCCWPASTAAVTPGSTCASLGISSRILGRTFCAVQLATSNHLSAAVNVTLTAVTRAIPQPLPSRARAVKGASPKLPPPKHPSSLKPALYNILSIVKCPAVQLFRYLSPCGSLLKARWEETTKV